MVNYKVPPKIKQASYSILVKLVSPNDIPDIDTHTSFISNRILSSTLSPLNDLFTESELSTSLSRLH